MNVEIPNENDQTGKRYLLYVDSRSHIVFVREQGKAKCDKLGQKNYGPQNPGGQQPDTSISTQLLVIDEGFDHVDCSWHDRKEQQHVNRNSDQDTLVG